MIYRRRISVVSTVIIPLLICILIGSTFLLVWLRSNNISLEYRFEKFNLTDQISNLDEVSENITELQHFIDDQKRNVLMQEKLISQLNNKKNSIEPSLINKREDIKSILRSNEKHLSSVKWHDILIGVSFGVISSICASALVSFIRKLKLKAS